MKKLLKIDAIKSGINIDLPSSKSYLNRALIVASCYHGKTILSNVNNVCDDVKELVEVLKQLGVDIKNDKKNKKIIVIRNGGKFQKPTTGILNCGLGGTTTRFIIGLSLLFDFDIKINANGKMLERPVKNLVDAIVKFGKKVEYLDKENCLPIRVSGLTRENKNIEIDCSKSSQFLTAILLVASHIGVRQIIAKNIVSKTYINITKDVLKKFGIDVKLIKKNNDLICEIFANNSTNSNTINRNIDIETDWSAATYFLALERIFNVKFDMKLSKKSSQGDRKFVKILDKIYNFDDKKNALILNMKTMPDAALTAIVACALQSFKTKIVGLETLKNKECDRLKAMHDELAKIGIKTAISKGYNAITIYGNADLKLKKDVEIETYNDHRIAMCFAILGLKLGHILVKKPEVVKKSFPNFWQELKKCYE